MHHHGYAWVGEKRAFDDEAVRRPPHPHPPPDVAHGDAVAQRLLDRHREVVKEFAVTSLPPIQTAHWLLKPAAAVRGTWADPEVAGAWLADRLAEYAPRFAHESERDPARLARLARTAVERSGWGGDVSLGHYLAGTLFHSVALVACSPNRTDPALPCPLRGD
ncbi:hypothetical protein ACH41E_31605 [Streptomyces sp. NPDC020412]|uniref:hypothetical protein n=1 Tax=Streptomyces sp. NPDC020412 TaxID=3365073 RepID=UPI0037A00178